MHSKLYHQVSCLRENNELSEAVRSYLVDFFSANVRNRRDPHDSEVATEYGYPIGAWCVVPDNITSLFALFKGPASVQLNEDLSMWDVSSVPDFGSMFDGATLFNQDISRWNVQGREICTACFARHHSLTKPSISGMLVELNLCMKHLWSRCRSTRR